ncbi:hypothetical protein MRS44_017112 [Fusarium solani]|uniref:uncharacterized protein n=1 Tax=Fusarium solani TaxID=169388 RepID=UPI0032C42767|nr:hypothetical protein MRS44_017112 [Fusarium solani]
MRLYHRWADGSCQSLPSIREVILSANLAPFLPTPATDKPGAPVPPIYIGTERHRSPHALHSPLSFIHPEHALLRSNSPKLPFKTGPSLAPDRPLSTPSRSNIPPHFNWQYGYRPPPPSAPPVPHQLAQPPPGHMSVPFHNVSPRPAISPHVPRLYDPWQAPPSKRTLDSARNRYNGTVNEHFESWSYQDWPNFENLCLEIGVLSRAILNFAAAGRLPTEQEFSDMLRDVKLIDRHLHQVKDLVQVSTQDERARGGAITKSPCEEGHDLLPPRNGIEGRKQQKPAVAQGECDRCGQGETDSLKQVG